MQPSTARLPREGMQARLRNRRGLIASVEPFDAHPEGRLHLVRVEYTDRDGTPEDTVIWEREPNATVLEPHALPKVDDDAPMPPEDFDALVRATRWSSLTPFLKPDGSGERSELPMMCLVLRKGSAAAHYIMGGPQATRNTAITLGTGTTEVYVMHGETAATAAFARRLVKEQDAGNDLQPTIDKMNALAQEYYDKSRPIYSAQKGFLDEVVKMTELRNYIVSFTRAAYQNPHSLCPHHQMMLPRIIKG